MLGFPSPPRQYIEAVTVDFFLQKHYTSIIKMEVSIMSLFDEYVSQSNETYTDTSYHYDEHTDRWIDEGHLPYGHSGHADVHTDEK